MPSFADSFWSEDLTSGLNVLFQKLHDGCNQCDAFIQLFASRMQYEANYGRHLYGVATEVDDIKMSADKERYMENTTGRGLLQLVTEMQSEGEQHLDISSKIQTLVLEPFRQWCIEHRERIKYSEKILLENVKNFQKSQGYVSKLQRDYFNKCKRLEDFKREHFKTDDDLEQAMKAVTLQRKFERKMREEKELEFFGKLGPMEFDKKTMRETLRVFLTQLPMSPYKLPFINYTLQNTNSGSEITKFILDNFSLKDMDQAESFGQDLLNLGFLKYCNGVGSSFVNSKKFQYQWRNYAFTFAQIPNRHMGGDGDKGSGTGDREILEDDEMDVGAGSEANLGNGIISNLKLGASSNFGNIRNYFLPKNENNLKDKGYSGNDSAATDTSGETKIARLETENDSLSLSNIDTQNEHQADQQGLLEPPEVTDAERTLHYLVKDVESSNGKYFRECNKMDNLRCSVEELVIDHLSFMEKCELDRFKAIKRATLDFCSTIGNNIASIKIHVQKMLDCEESMDPSKDLLGIITRYHAGLFRPRVITYNNYYSPGAYQNFGSGLETRCHLDNRSVPLIISAILSYMDQIYPDMESDKVRVSIWTNPVKLSLTHGLRSKLNNIQFTNESEIHKIFREGHYDSSTVASVLKIYLLELSEPLIAREPTEVLGLVYQDYSLDSSDVTIKIKGNDPTKDTEEKRIAGLMASLSSLSRSHLATLDVIITHFYRLIKILRMAGTPSPLSSSKSSTSTDKNEVEQLVSNFMCDISKEFANCIIQARRFEDNELGCMIFYDLLTHKEEVFRELKRQISPSRRHPALN